MQYDLPGYPKAKSLYGSGSSGANVEHTVTGDSDEVWAVTRLSFSFAADPGSSYVELKSGSTVIWKQFIVTAGAYDFNYITNPIRCKKGKALTVTLVNESVDDVTLFVQYA